MSKAIQSANFRAASNIYIYIYRLKRRLCPLSPHFPIKSTLNLKSISLIFLFCLGLFGFITLSSAFSSSASATTIDYNVNVEPALNVTIPTDTISLLLDPTNKTFSSQELNISVGTNNPYGYRLTMSSTGTSLIHTEDSNYTIPTLPTLAGGYTDESFIADKWGYKQDSSAWNSYTSGVTLLESNAPVNNDNTNLSFGAKIDYDQAPGNYTLVLNFNAVAKVATNDLVITFAGEGVNSVKVCTVAGDCTGDNLIGTVTTSGNSVPGLEDGSTYYLYPTFTTNHEFVSWEKTSDAGTISDASILNPTFTMTDEPASVTITGQSSAVYLYDTIAAKSKGDFDMSTINTGLTTSNSGVYRYTGSSSDGASTNNIYFYRGIIDSSFASTYGSTGDGTLYPNYVKLTTGSNTTCWRIFRTTGSGGVKMIYNGLWTGSTCANAQTSAQLSSTVYYNRPSTYASASCSSSNAYCGTQGFITYAGYNYNNTYAYNNTSYTSAVNNSTLFNNGTASNIRTQVENWYTSTIGTSYSSLFETNAGYCNDRTTYTSTSGSAATTTVPYKTSSATVYFGSYIRNITNGAPTLQCPNTSGNDLLNGTTGKSYPVALITADEAALAGNGCSGKEAYSKTSYLTSGSVFWSLSPGYRYSSGDVYVFGVRSGGNLNLNYAFGAISARPVVSLTPGTTIKSGSGTAADPWVVQ
ncbi:MAG: hypothetical protein Q4B87_00795 [Candidatus Saccharibacteria bacterium]|nr:hypothetical protein [Candidatus Saccharibacteria bacterium]